MCQVAVSTIWQLYLLLLPSSIAKKTPKNSGRISCNVFGLGEMHVKHHQKPCVFACPCCFAAAMLNVLLQTVPFVGLKLGLGCCSYVGTEDGKPFVFVSSIWDDQPKPLAAGDEVFISYMASTPPLTAFLNLGFVPEELLMP